MKGDSQRRCKCITSQKIFVNRNPLCSSVNPASLQRNTQSHWQPEGVNKTPAHDARDAILPHGTWGMAKTAVAPLLELWLLAGPL